MSLLALPGGTCTCLFGTQAMTEALRQLASQLARSVPTRLVRSPVPGHLARTRTTMAIRSSSATMVTTIGFVGAGLVSFPQAIGIVVGAHIGTTVTATLSAIGGSRAMRQTAAAHVAQQAGHARSARRD